MRILIYGAVTTVLIAFWVLVYHVCIYLLRTAEERAVAARGRRAVRALKASGEDGCVRPFPLYPSEEQVLAVL